MYFIPWGLTAKLPVPFVPTPLPSPPALSTLSLLKTQPPAQAVCLPGDLVVSYSTLARQSQDQCVVFSPGEACRSSVVSGKTKTVRQSLENCRRPTMGCTKACTPVETGDSKGAVLKGKPSSLGLLMTYFICGLVFLFMHSHDG